ncbi:nose resistant to fluoxetine protein 6 [Caerostris darwini]|uniref:Nose resistant to fluoxetine protein 6 n=1 Tax=Caerostris darwini TaxID=1538125 RepID=A0AAV4USA3_9ARAC|nr:nose resistant to fluoxetine protein 6 [Caerostris darwini]
MRSMRIFSLTLAAFCCIVLFSELTDGALVDKSRIDGILKDDDRIESLSEAEKKLKRLVNSGFKMALPYLMTIVTETRLSGKCLSGLLMVVKGVMDIKSWAVRLLDALGKPSAGLLEGTATALGDYDECLDITVPRRMRPVPVPPYTEKQIAFHGQFCVVEIGLPKAIKQAAMAYQIGNRSSSELANSKTFLKDLVQIAPRADVAAFRMGVCIPSVCTQNDLQLIINEVSKLILLDANTIRCETKQKANFEVQQILILCVYGIIGLLILFGTSLDVLLQFTKTETIDDFYLRKQSMWIQSAMAFSIPRNTQKLLSLTTNDNSKIPSVRGMKFLTILLYIVVWTYASPNDYHFFKFRSAFYFFKFLEQIWFSIFANGAMGIDTLFLIAGLHISYQFWRKSVYQRIAVNAHKFLLKWYSRFALSQLLIISLVLCLPLIGSGPIWADIVTPEVENCKKRWWLNILALNNFWSSDDTCLVHTWLVCCLFHMFIIAPILLFILSRSTTVGIFVNCIIIMGSSVAIAMVTLMNDLPPSLTFYLMSFANIKTLWQKIFIQAYSHIAPFCIGILLGFFITRYDKIQLRKTTVLLGWLGAIVLNLTVLCGLYGYHDGQAMDMSLSAIYASVHRIVWALTISWMIFACTYGYGGFVNSILSSKFLIPCDRIAVLVYVLHPLILFIHEGQLRENMFMGHLDQLMHGTACVVITIVFAAICYITCAAPFEFFEKKVWYEPPPSYEAEDAENPKCKGKSTKCCDSIDMCKQQPSTSAAGDSNIRN